LKLTVTIKTTKANLCQLGDKNEISTPRWPPMATYKVAAISVAAATVRKAALVSLLWLFEDGRNLISPAFSPSKLKLEMSVVMAINAEAIPICEGEYKCDTNIQKPKPRTDIIAVLAMSSVALRNKLSFLNRCIGRSIKAGIFIYG